MSLWVPGRGSWVRASGKADISTGTPEESSYRFRIGSITKTFTATVILQLAEEGKVSLDDKLEKYVSGFKYGDEITIRNLCNNTSGVYAYDDTPGFTEETINSPQRRWSPRELVDLARAGERPARWYRILKISMSGPRPSPPVSCSVRLCRRSASSGLRCPGRRSSTPRTGSVSPQWVSPADPFSMGAAAILFPGKMPWDK